MGSGMVIRGRATQKNRTGFVAEAATMRKGSRGVIATSACDRRVRVEGQCATHPEENAAVLGQLRAGQVVEQIVGMTGGRSPLADMV